jgi:DNA-binding transcriptional MerR regulator
MFDDNVDYSEQVIEQMEQVTEVTEEPSPLEKIQTSLEEYVDICKSIKDVRNEVKLFTERKTELEEEISNFMRDNNVPEFTTSDGKNKIKLYESNTKVPLNKDYLREVAKSKLDEKTLEEIIALAFDRPINNSMKIKLAAPKK